MYQGGTCNHPFARFIGCNNSIRRSRANFLSLYLSKRKHSPPPNHSRNERQAQLDVHFSLIWRFRLQKTSHRDVFCGATQRATLAGLITRRPRGVSLGSATKRKGNPYGLPFLLVAERGLEPPDLRVMSPTSYHLLHSAVLNLPVILRHCMVPVTGFEPVRYSRISGF